MKYAIKNPNGEYHQGGTRGSFSDDIERAKLYKKVDHAKTAIARMRFYAWNESFEKTDMEVMPVDVREQPAYSFQYGEYE